MSNAWSAVAGNARNGQSTFTSTWITTDYEYAILVRHDWHPIVCQRTRNPIGSWVTHDVYDTVIGLIEVKVTGATDATGTNSYFYVDDVNVAYPAGVAIDLGNLDLWAEGLPVSPAIATMPSLGGVWDEPMSAHTIPGSMGKAQNDTNRNSGLIPATV